MQGQEALSWKGTGEMNQEKEQDSTTDGMWGFEKHIWTYKKVPVILPSLSSDGIGQRRKRN